MRRIIVLLCLGLIGCATTAQDSKVLPASAKTPVTYSEEEINDIITVFSEAIKKSPDYGGGYYNRALAYFYFKKDYNKCWQDVHQAQVLGYRFDVDFLKALRKASGRED